MVSCEMKKAVVAAVVDSTTMRTVDSYSYVTIAVASLHRSIVRMSHRYESCQTSDCCHYCYSRLNRLIVKLTRMMWRSWASGEC